MMAKALEGVVKVNVSMDRNVVEAINWLSKMRKSPNSEIIRVAVKEYVVAEIRKEQADMAILAEVQQPIITVETEETEEIQGVTEEAVNA
jgi:metal-responsive CopG/Arc/MetJ family transcriptional regulator